MTFRSEIALTTRLTESDWDSALRGWRCPILNVPGAVIDDLYVQGERIDKAKYEMLAAYGVIRWIPTEQPASATISVRLTESLTKRADTERWKKLAILLPVLASIASASISAVATYYTKQPSTPTRTPKITPETKFKIMMPRGNKVIVEWEGMPKDGPGDDMLRRNGIALSDVDEGTRLAYSSLTKKRVEAIQYFPLSIDGKLVPGYAQGVIYPGPADNAGYDEFQLFQGAQEFTIYVFRRGEIAPLTDPDKIGIDWSRVRSGLKKALEALYKGKKAANFDTVGLYREPSGIWEYRLPYTLSDR